MSVHIAIVMDPILVICLLIKLACTQQSRSSLQSVADGHTAVGVLKHSCVSCHPTVCVVPHSPHFPVLCWWCIHLERNPSGTEVQSSAPKWKDSVRYLMQKICVREALLGTCSCRVRHKFRATHLQVSLNRKHVGQRSVDQSVHWNVTRAFQFLYFP